jgi:hypothetical protein
LLSRISRMPKTLPGLLACYLSWYAVVGFFNQGALHNGSQLH